MGCCCSSNKNKYDVFLSFRGEDTRDNFTSHLCKALSQKKIKIYVDDMLERGDEISTALLKAIKKSRVSIIIFSENYASSSWCLDELVQILKCKKKNNKHRVIIPVFYGVDPSRLRSQHTKFVFSSKGSKAKRRAWREALNHAANISGWGSQNIRPESKLVEAIVEDVMKKLNRS
ncbi:putative disease resistance protein At4g11170 [Humulus lupulus]|uniref:putative disease resistance protein At4g11170 n=1 Tax=Humulus lupulus TaxID=3486 RepID=UPI002B40309E|nr:putative disease resistance protein At4g11170 [Humulus lupulus]